MILSHPLKGTIKRASNFLLVNISFCTIKGIFSHCCDNSLHGRALLYKGSLRFSSSLLFSVESSPSRFEPATYLLAVGWPFNYTTMAYSNRLHHSLNQLRHTTKSYCYNTVYKTAAAISKYCYCTQKRTGLHMKALNKLPPYTEKRKSIFPNIRIRKFRMEQLQSHIRLTASSYMGKQLRISSYIRKPFLIYHFATDPLCISSYMRII